jgi:hypothetical protein
MDKPLTFWDRLVYGSIAGVIGALLGLAASLCLLFALGSVPPVRWIVLASAAYFFGIGVVRGVVAADFTGEAVGAVAGVAMVDAGALLDPSTKSDAPWTQWSSPVLLFVWIAIVALAAWLL